MKKVTLLLASISLMILTSCNEKTEKETVTEKTVVVEQEAEPVQEEDANGTSLSVGSDGVEFSTTNDNGGTDINIDTKKDEK